MAEPKVIMFNVIFLVLAVVTIIIGLKLDKHFQKDYRISIWKGSMVLALAVATIVVPTLDFLQIPLYYPVAYQRLVMGAGAVLLLVLVYNTFRVRSLGGSLKLFLVQLMVMPGAAVLLVIGGAAARSSQRARQRADGDIAP